MFETSALFGWGHCLQMADMVHAEQGHFWMFILLVMYILNATIWWM